MLCLGFFLEDTRLCLASPLVAFCLAFTSCACCSVAPPQPECSTPMMQGVNQVLCFVAQARNSAREVGPVTVCEVFRCWVFLLQQQAPLHDAHLPANNLVALAWAVYTLQAA